MNIKFLYISNISRERDALIIELFREEPKFIESLSLAAKVILRVLKPITKLDEKKIHEEIDPYNDGVIYKIEKKAQGMLLTLGGATDIEIECASVEESEVGLSTENLFQALKEWRILCNDAQDSANENHNKLHELVAYCDKAKKIAEKKLSEAKWLEEPQKEALKSRIEVLTQILELLKASH